MSKSFAQGLILFALLALSPAFAATLDVNVTNLRNTDGQLLAIVFASADGFPSETAKATTSLTAPVVSGENHLIFRDLTPGSYAIALIHDENGNLKLDTGLFGIPKEPIGFSNNPTLGFGAPSFEKVAVKVDGDTGITVRMKHY